jgi:D-glycerate 3-kinase
MIKSFLIPLCFWISKKADKKRPYFVGLAGGQGTGKTTSSSLIKIILTKYFKLKVFKISIDDFYKTRNERISLSKKVHPMLLTRGVPGTHDIDMMLKFFKKVKSKKFKRLKLPTFNKAIDDRFNKKRWYDLKEKPDVIIFEGWCVGAKAEKNNTLNKTINLMEKNKDKKKIWRKYVNQQLKSKYKNLYSQLNCLIYLRAKNFNLLQKWRLKQERKLLLSSKKNSKLKIMNKEDVLSFMQTYQRVTQNMFKNMPKYASIILNLNSNHQIKTAVYKKR